MKTIIDTCMFCGVHLWHDPEEDRMFWEDDGGLGCEHEGAETYRGKNPNECGMCQGTGQVLIQSKKIRVVQCDACHGKGVIE